MCLFARAILPRCCWDLVLPEQLPIVAKQVGSFEGPLVGDAKFFSDGAGGCQKHLANIKRAGAGAAAVKAEWKQGCPTVVAAAVAWQTFPGIQTVPRAEVAGASKALALAEPGQRKLAIDAAYVMNGATNHAKSATIQFLLYFLFAASCAADGGAGDSMC